MVKAAVSCSMSDASSILEASLGIDLHTNASRFESRLGTNDSYLRETSAGMRVDQKLPPLQTPRIFGFASARGR